MKSFKLLACLIIALNLCHAIFAKSYKDHKVVSFTIDNEEQLKEIQSLEANSGFTFWDSPEYVNSKIDLVMAPELFPMFEEIAILTKINFVVATDDFQIWLDAEKPRKQRKEGFSLEQYNILEDIHQYLDDMAAAYPAVASVFVAGESYEGRQLKGIKLSTSDKNPAIFIEATIHAREWISTATALWIVNEILTTTDAAIREAVDSVTWYILPVTNPDGYVYTHEENRLWRKTRSIHNILCRGVDPNRNFGFNWRQGGSSNLACSDTYAGPAAFSEKETKALMDFYETISHEVELYLCFHSAAQMLMYPLGNTLSTENVPNAEHLEEIAKYSAEALERSNGTVYQYGNAMKTLYVTSGSSRDHAYGHFKTPLVFTYEMREGKTTGSIFILPEEEIHPNSKEIFDSLIAMIEKAKELGYFKLLE